MMKKSFKKIALSIASFFLLSLVFANVALAIPLLKSTSSAQTDAFQSSAGFVDNGEEAAPAIIANIIDVILSLLAIIFVVLIIFSGYQWMTAGGNEDDVKKAQARMKNAVIGLVIVIAAYAITAFVFTRLGNVTGGSSSGGVGGSGINP